eukprot:CAMPEP_0197666986 /NCGR_PEP_ID=MMETSP1338-20131121/64709_1 /TAXON_ID=43686 ORGANISM="Pelagodinium beii, Strain RCC1491" /NCGR_SAMPLE_ID=MMETSP1338 /ASSEMBLY_ACC=CAM_ASM_000754 /LENGTH=278 /DNA_ID=CAMNT_0043246129 /DNA_START=1 /DNA_END=834 /DNA_ORIENTATION=+
MLLGLLAATASGGGTGSPDQWESKEEKRVEIFRRVHGTWPVPRTFPGRQPRAESKGWEEHMQEYERAARQADLGDNTKSKWELYLDLAQMRMLANYSESGWSVSEMDKTTHESVVALYKDSKSNRRPEGNAGLQTLYIEGEREVWDEQRLPRNLREKIYDRIKSALAEWLELSPEELEKTSAYGFRVYKKGSVLKYHVDHLETHVFSAVYCLDIDEDPLTEPWHLQALPDFTGEVAKVDLRPGQLFLYESAKLPHGRPGTFAGREYAALFVHFKPNTW